MDSFSIFTEISKKYDLTAKNKTIVLLAPDKGLLEVRHADAGAQGKVARLRKYAELPGEHCLSHVVTDQSTLAPLRPRSR